MPSFEEVEIDFTCPVCRLDTAVTLGQIQRGDYVICRGCHRTIKLIDQLGGIQNLTEAVSNLFEKWAK